MITSSPLVRNTFFKNKDGELEEFDLFDGKGILYVITDIEELKTVCGMHDEINHPIYYKGLLSSLLNENKIQKFHKHIVIKLRSNA